VKKKRLFVPKSVHTNRACRIVHRIDEMVVTIFTNFCCTRKAISDICWVILMNTRSPNIGYNTKVKNWWAIFIHPTLSNTTTLFYSNFIILYQSLSSANHIFTTYQRPSYKWKQTNERQNSHFYTPSHNI